MDSSTCEDKRRQLTVAQIDAARRQCYNAILVHNTELAQFRSIVAAASDTDADPDKYQKLASAWCFHNDRLHEEWHQLVYCVIIA